MDREFKSRPLRQIIRFRRTPRLGRTSSEPPLDLPLSRDSWFEYLTMTLSMVEGSGSRTGRGELAVEWV
ncbi:MAG: hypothetical protein ACE1ZE_05000 [Candidatus Binatia bacterium]